jgi:hypothetical protein
VKRCPDCGLLKPLDDFPRHRRNPDGRATYCKPCHNARGRASRERIWGATRFYHLKGRYGLSRSEFEAIWQRQRGLCAICRERPAEHVDHDHATRRVRGLLCFNCNGGLGQFKDDPTRLALAIAYLRQPAIDPPQASLDLIGADQ